MSDVKVRNCGHCGGEHETFAQAQLCAQRNRYRRVQRQPAPQPQVAEPQQLPLQPAPALQDQPSQPVPARQPVIGNRRRPFPTFAELCEKVDWPDKGVLHFALPSREHPDKPFLFVAKKGRVKGKVFVNRISEHGAPKLDVDTHHQSWALTQLVANQGQAELLYAKVTEHCSRCDKFLSDPRSVACGYGPDCYKLKFGVPQPKLAKTTG